MKNIFKPEVTSEIINRIALLTQSTQPNWGKMSIEKMLAHCNVTYELVYDNMHPKPNGFVKFIMKHLLKNAVVNEKPYKKNGQTGPQFIIKDERNFEIEKTRLVNYLLKTQQLGEGYFDGKESHSFGILTKDEWNNMFYKHINHHLTQFGV